MSSTFDKWLRFRHIVDRGLALHGDAAMDRLALEPGARVLDVGCGLGLTTMALAHRIGQTGEAVGVDKSSRFIEAASVEARRRGIPNVRFGARDVERDDLGGPYDVAFSRFGMTTMADVVQALSNVRRALVPNGRLCMVVWRRPEENEWLRADSAAFSLASADRVSEQLIEAGYRRIVLERFDARMAIGRDVAEAIEFALALGSSSASVHGAFEDADDERAESEAALESMRAADGAIHARSSSWIVTAMPTR